MAQVPSPAQIKQVNVDNLSDDQIRRIVAEMKQNNMSMDDIDSYAEQKGVPAAEAEKLKTRIQMMGLDKSLDKRRIPRLFNPIVNIPGGHLMMRIQLRLIYSDKMQ